MSNVFVFLPSRLGSKRFPGKPLADIGGKTLIQRCWESVRESGFDPYVITPDHEILDAAEKFGAKTVLTSDKPQNGTERVWEAADILRLDPKDILVNCQADQFGWQDPEFLNVCIDAVKKDQEEDDRVHTTYSPHCVWYELDSYNSVKVFQEVGGVDFSRVYRTDMKLLGLHYGVYVARARAFHFYTTLSPSEREKDEKLEQLRWPYKIIAHPVTSTPWKIDSPEDLMVYLATR